MIIPSSKYPAQTAIDLTNYPQGKARNVTAAGDGTGTPLEKDWINDWFGFQQAAILAAGITPSGTPDTAIASQLLSALHTRQIGCYGISTGVAKANGATFDLFETVVRGGFSRAGNLITVPVAVYYRVTLSGVVTTSLTTNPASMGVSLIIASAYGGLNAVSTRFSASPSDQVPIMFDGVTGIGTPGSQQISIEASTSGTIQFASSASATFTIERVG